MPGAVVFSDVTTLTAEGGWVRQAHSQEVGLQVARDLGNANQEHLAMLANIKVSSCL